MSGFFSPEEKLLAKKLPAQEIKRRYERSERELRRAAQSGSIKRVEKVMKTHRKWEYAGLYQEVLKNKQKNQKQKRSNSYE